MYDSYLEMFELREIAFVARDKAAQVRRFVARLASPSPELDVYAAALDARAVDLERRMAELANSGIEAKSPR